MKSILFHYSVFNRGGAEKSTLRLMRLFLEQGWDVNLVLNFRGGAMEEEIPDNIKKYYLSFFSLADYQKGYCAWLYRFIDYIRALFMVPILLWKKYDIACVGLQGLNPFLVCNVIRAKKKMIFIRNDISLCQNKEKIVSNLIKYKSKLDKIICVSGTVKDSVDKEVPVLKNKTKIVYNVIRPDEMQSKLIEAKNPYPVSGYLKVVTVCRMVDKAKGLFRILEAYDKLFTQGIYFEWFFVGDGVDLPKMKEIVKGKPYEDLLHFEGEKSNPFPYYKYADLVAVLSYYEGLCGIVNEAKVSGAAVIATEFSGVHEQIVHGESGWIVENNLEGIVEGLRKLLNDQTLLNKLRNNGLSPTILNDKDKVRQIVED